MKYIMRTITYTIMMITLTITMIMEAMTTTMTNLMHNQWKTWVA